MGQTWGGVPRSKNEGRRAGKVKDLLTRQDRYLINDNSCFYWELLFELEGLSIVFIVFAKVTLGSLECNCTHLNYILVSF